MDNEKQQPLTYRFTKVQRRIVTAVYLYPVSSTDVTKSVVTHALWDTGATMSAISPDIAAQLNLKPIVTIDITGVHDKRTVPAGIITAELPDNVIRENLLVAICKFSPSIGMILGMDIISLGDFAIFNKGQTIMAFRVPSDISPIDYVARI